LAQHIGEKGRVYAVDVSPEVILHMNHRIRDLGTKNVITLLTPPMIPCCRTLRWIVSLSVIPGTISIIRRDT
jgi:hypothetical protein